MKVCEVCGGVGCTTGCVLCAACQGTGFISLGHESAARYESLVVEAREKAARLGWSEEVWEPVDPVLHYPALARKVFRVVTVPQTARNRERKVG